jgi:serine/threonine-protein kinase ATR
VFRRSCEVTLRLLRDHRELLCNVLETFVHDPLIEWNTQRAGRLQVGGRGRSGACVRKRGG